MIDGRLIWKRKRDARIATNIEFAAWLAAAHSIVPAIVNGRQIGWTRHLDRGRVSTHCKAAMKRRLR